MHQMVTACERGYKRDRGLTQGGPDDIISQFWSVWPEHEEKLDRCCLEFMNWNVTEAYIPERMRETLIWQYII